MKTTVRQKIAAVKKMTYHETEHFFVNPNRAINEGDVYFDLDFDELLHHNNFSLR